MILADTSIWIGFWRGVAATARLETLLEEGDVLLHAWVLGELALGHLGPRRKTILADLDALPQAPIVPHQEVRAMVEARGLAGSGLGWVDVQLLASARLAGADLWSADQRLARAWSALQ